MVAPVGAWLGLFFGAAFATEVQKRAHRHEKRELAERLVNLEQKLEAKAQATQKIKADMHKEIQNSEILERAKRILEEKIKVLEESILEKTEEAKKARQEREKVLTHLKA